MRFFLYKVIYGSEFFNIFCFLVNLFWLVFGFYKNVVYFESKKYMNNYN